MFNRTIYSTDFPSFLRRAVESVGMYVYLAGGECVDFVPHILLKTLIGERTKAPVRIAVTPTRQKSLDNILNSIDDELAGGVYKSVLRVESLPGIETYAKVAGKNLAELLSEHGYTEIQKVCVYFKNTARTFMDVENKATIVFTSNGDTYKGMHWLWSGLPVFLPWFFVDSPITEEEKRMLSTLLRSDENAWKDFIETATNLFDKDTLYKEYLEQELRNYESKFLEAEISQLEASIDKWREKIQETLAELSSRTKEKEIAMAKLNAFVNSKREEGELLRYFSSHRNLKLVGTEYGHLRFEVSGYIDYFDEDAVSVMIGNRESVLYGYCSDDDIEIYESILNDIFVNRTIRIKTMARYELKETLIQARTSNVYEFEGTPNPHIHNYTCLGDYVRVFAECIQRGDIIMAIEQACASTCSLNVMDHPVMRAFITTLFKGYDKDGVVTNNRCLELEGSNELYTIEELIKMRKQEEE